jgi:hypothetical protein
MFSPRSTKLFALKKPKNKGKIMLLFRHGPTQSDFVQLLSVLHILNAYFMASNFTGVTNF